MSGELVRIFDTTLRDGEQTPGVQLTLPQKLGLAEMLSALRVDVIEAGFPGFSQSQFDGVRRIAERVQHAVICGIARPGQADIEVCGEALRPAQRRRIHVFISTSPLHMRHEQKLTPEEVLEAITRSITHARNLTDDVEWTASDATRAERDFLKRCVETAIRAGATTIDVPDTVGCSHPAAYADLIRDLRASVPGADEVVFSTHCHDDLGLATANSLAGVDAGARQIQCSLNGLGERAGNAPLEEVVMALRVREDASGFRTNVDTQLLNPASRLAAAITGVPVAFNKAVVGRNAFSHVSAIHRGALEADRRSYEIMSAEEVGWTGVEDSGARP